ncbi:hypothetical protein V6N12_013892 [Hibiscus sabdariffa]|uniref:Uncharacterized protein n=1 Tax=Hibiscus sabdariffa TaxID=183260 RepID=A0ABR1ZSF4_9ROSI
MLGDMTRTMHRFWWTRRTNKRGWPLCAWDRVCTTKTAGVLGLRNLQSQHTSSRAKYFPLGNVLDAPLMEKSILFHGKVYTEPWRSSKMTFTGNWTLIVDEEHALRASIDNHSTMKGDRGHGKNRGGVRGRGNNDRGYQNYDRAYPKHQQQHKYHSQRRGRGRGGHHSTSFRTQSADKSSIECF